MCGTGLHYIVALNHEAEIEWIQEVIRKVNEGLNQQSKSAVTHVVQCSNTECFLCGRFAYVLNKPSFSVQELLHVWALFSSSTSIKVDSSVCSPFWGGMNWDRSTNCTFDSATLLGMMRMRTTPGSSSLWTRLSTCHQPISLLSHWYCLWTLDSMPSAI